MSRWQILMLAATMVLAATPTSAETNVDPTGVWLTETGDAKIHRVRVRPCQASDRGQALESGREHRFAADRNARSRARVSPAAPEGQVIVQRRTSSPHARIDPRYR